MKYKDVAAFKNTAFVTGNFLQLPNRIENQKPSRLAIMTKLIKTLVNFLWFYESRECNFF